MVGKSAKWNSSVHVPAACSAGSTSNIATTFPLSQSEASVSKFRSYPVHIGSFEIYIRPTLRIRRCLQPRTSEIRKNFAFRLRLCSFRQLHAGIGVLPIFFSHQHDMLHANAAHLPNQSCLRVRIMEDPVPNTAPICPNGRAGLCRIIIPWTHTCRVADLWWPSGTFANLDGFKTCRYPPASCTYPAVPGPAVPSREIPGSSADRPIRSKRLSITRAP